jgi:hypothetical protein
MERFYILLKNIYNFDEKDFLINISRKYKRIVILAQLLIKQSINASQNGSREFIIFIIIICADGSHISSILIYKNESGVI